MQTQASAAGTLACVFASLPALVMAGVWQRFPFIMTAALTAAGGMTGVLFTIPLRRVMLADPVLPFPEGWRQPKSCARVRRPRTGAASARC